ncbi:hypothetical protein D3C81_2267280 [compost metagenome]
MQGERFDQAESAAYIPNNRSKYVIGESWLVTVEVVFEQGQHRVCALNCAGDGIDRNAGFCLLADAE